jgi:hypothetical protein
MKPSVRAWSLLVLVAFIRCGAESKAERMLERGQTAEAERFLRAEVAKNPNDPDLHFLLGRACVATGDHRCADREFLIVATTDAWKLKIAKVYQDALPAASAVEDDVPEAEYVATVAALDPNARRSACEHLIQSVAQRRTKRRPYESLARASMRVDADCASRTADMLEKWLRAAATTRNDDASDLAAIGVAVEPSRAADFAKALRGLAIAAGDADRERARHLLDSAIRLHPGIRGDFETIVLLDRLTPKSLPTQDSRSPYEQNVTELYGGTPLDATMRVIQELARGVELYAVDYNRYPPARSMSELRSMLSSFMRQVPTVDAWGSEVAYVFGNGYRLVSAGADHEFSGGSLQLGTPGAGMVAVYGTDVIYENGRFIQAPTAAAAAPLPSRVPTSRPQ